MWIVTYDRMSVINAENIVLVERAGKYIYAYENCADKMITLGRYESPDKCKEIFEKLLADMFPNPQPIQYISPPSDEDAQKLMSNLQQNLLLCNDHPQVTYCTQEVYYMPTE